MTGFVNIKNVLSDQVTGDVIGLIGLTGREIAHPGTITGNDSSAAPGNATHTGTHGRCAIAAAASSVVITNRNVNPASTVVPVLTGAAADATLTSIPRVVCANGSFTLFGNAASTAAIQVDYLVFGQL